MSIGSWFSSFWAATEADVLQLVVNIKQDVAIAEADIASALNWIANNTPAIVADIQSVLSVVQVIGVGNPTVAAAVTAANEAVSALNAFSTSYQSGSGSTTAVLAGYSALKLAQAAAATAASVAASAPPKA